jgi:hypothetical protein
LFVLSIRKFTLIHLTLTLSFEAREFFPRKFNPLSFEERVRVR